MKEKPSVGLAILSLLTIPLTTMLNGYSVQVMWTWFVSETFGVRQLGLAQAIGLGMVASLITGVTSLYIYLMRNIKNESKDPNVDMISSILISFFFPLFTLAMGWLVHQFI